MAGAPPSLSHLLRRQTATHFPTFSPAATTIATTKSTTHLFRPSPPQQQQQLLPQQVPLPLQLTRPISSHRHTRHKRWHRRHHLPTPPLYGRDPIPTSPRRQDPSFAFPTIHFWDQDPSTGTRQHLASVRSESELAELARRERAQDAALRELEREYEGASGHLPEEARVRLAARVREVEGDAAHQEALRRLMVMAPEDREVLEELEGAAGPGGAPRVVVGQEMEDLGVTMAEMAEVVERNVGPLGSARQVREVRERVARVQTRVKELNSALCLAYVGANDEVRAELWRAYVRAKAVPGVLEWIPDDAWDMIYWSQAAKWGSNANREDHLRILEEDLRSVGRDGPPTKDLM